MLASRSLDRWFLARSWQREYLFLISLFCHIALKENVEMNDELVSMWKKAL
jgi:hypothetical protein